MKQSPRVVAVVAPVPEDCEVVVDAVSVVVELVLVELVLVELPVSVAVVVEAVAVDAFDAPDALLSPPPPPHAASNIADADNASREIDFFMIIPLSKVNVNCLLMMRMCFVAFKELRGARNEKSLQLFS